MIDLMIASLLVATLCYGYVLSRRISKLRAALIELGPMFEAFSEAVGQSEKAVKDMRAISTNMDRPSGAARSAGYPEEEPERSKKDMIKDFFNRQGR